MSPGEVTPETFIDVGQLQFPLAELPVEPLPAGQWTDDHMTLTLTVWLRCNVCDAVGTDCTVI